MAKTTLTWRQRNARIVRAYKAGATVQEMAVQFGVDRTTIYNVLRHENLPLPKVMKMHNARQEIVRLRLEGVSLRQIAKMTRTSRADVATALRGAGLDTSRIAAGGTKRGRLKSASTEVAKNENASPEPSQRP